MLKMSINFSFLFDKLIVSFLVLYVLSCICLFTSGTFAGHEHIHIRVHVPKIINEVHHKKKVFIHKVPVIHHTHEKVPHEYYHPPSHGYSSLGSGGFGGSSHSISHNSIDSGRGYDYGHASGGSIAAFLGSSSKGFGSGDLNYGGYGGSSGGFSGGSSGGFGSGSSGSFGGGGSHEYQVIESGHGSDYGKGSLGGALTSSSHSVSGLSGFGGSSAEHDASSYSSPGIGGYGGSYSSGDHSDYDVSGGISDFSHEDYSSAGAALGGSYGSAVGGADHYSAGNSDYGSTNSISSDYGGYGYGGSSHASGYSDSGPSSYSSAKFAGSYDYPH